jgi:hypothetical protein
LTKYLGPILPSFITKLGFEKETRLNRTHIERLASSQDSYVGQLTLSPTALLPPPYPTALGLIGPSKKDRNKPVLLTSPRSHQS